MNKIGRSGAEVVRISNVMVHGDGFEYIYFILRFRITVKLYIRIRYLIFNECVKN